MRSRPQVLARQEPGRAGGGRRAGAAICYSAPNTFDDLPAAAALNVFVVHEGLRNSVRPWAGEAAVTLTGDHRAVHVEIENEGVLTDVPAPTGSGLAGVHERVRAAEGTVQSGAAHPGAGGFCERASRHERSSAYRPLRRSRGALSDHHTDGTTELVDQNLAQTSFPASAAFTPQEMTARSDLRQGRMRTLMAADRVLPRRIPSD